MNDELTNNRGRLGFILNGPRAPESTVSSVESREINRALAAISKCTNANAFSLKILKRSRYIQEALTARADDRHRGTTQLSEISFKSVSPCQISFMSKLSSPEMSIEFSAPRCTPPVMC